MTPNAGRGRFIVFEGGEGAGKSTVLAAVAAHLRAAGRVVVETREPGGTPLGERIRHLILDAGGVDDPLAELLLFEAARAHLVATVIRPALARGEIVLCDRFAASSIAYQSYGRGLPRETVERANDVATGGLAPDLTVLLDVPVEAGLARRAREGDANHFDREAVAFHERVRRGFLELAAASPEAWVVIDASGERQDVIDAAIAAIAREGARPLE
jgi:dTMP kinase